MICFYLRNEERDAEGRHVGMMDGYRPGHDLEFVQSFYSTLASALEACEYGFALFNRGSGQECYFSGRSMSVGDLVIVERIGGDAASLAAYKCASAGFEPVEWEQRFDWLLDGDEDENDEN